MDRVPGRAEAERHPATEGHPWSRFPGPAAPLPPAHVREPRGLVPAPRRTVRVTALGGDQPRARDGRRLHARAGPMSTRGRRRGPRPRRWRGLLDGKGTVGTPVQSLFGYRNTVWFRRKEWRLFYLRKTEAQKSVGPFWVSCPIEQGLKVDEGGVGPGCF